MQSTSRSYHYDQGITLLEIDQKQKNVKEDSKSTESTDKEDTGRFRTDTGTGRTACALQSKDRPLSDRPGRRRDSGQDLIKR